MKEKSFYPKSMTYCSLEYILEHFDEFKFCGISIDTFFYKEIDGERTKVNLVDDNYPIGVGKSILNMDGSILIEKKYYLDNKEHLDKLINKIIEKMKDYVSISGTELITDNLIDSISKNNNLSYVSLYGDDYSDYSLSKETYEKIKQNSNIKSISTRFIDKELEDNFDPIISYNRRNLIDGYNYSMLQEEKDLHIKKTLNDKEIEYLKFLNPECNISFITNNYENVIRIMKRLDELGHNPKYTFFVEDKNAFNNMIFSNEKFIKNKNISINIDLNTYDIETYFKYEKRLFEMIEPALELSPLERFLYAYNKAKKYKEYKENEDDLGSSRTLYDVLDNEYMVCVGFSKLLVDLLSKLGIKAEDYSNGIGVGLESIPNKDLVANEKIYKYGGHARVQVKIVDEKYGIDGVYISDPTWDNVMDKDYYNNALLTRKENNSKYRDNYLSYSTIEEILDSDNIDEFYRRVNYAIDLKAQDSKKDNLMLINSMFINNKDKLEKNEFFNERDIVKCILKSIKKKYNYGDYNYYIGELSKEDFIKEVFSLVVNELECSKITTEEQLQKVVDEKVLYKYKNKDEKDNYSVGYITNKLSDYVKSFNPGLYEKIISQVPDIVYFGHVKSEDCYKVIEIIGDYVVRVNNNEISGKILMDAVKEIYIYSGMSEEEASQRLKETIKDNKERQERMFPKRIKINPDGTEEVYMNEKNKFSLEERVMK